MTTPSQPSGNGHADTLTAALSYQAVGLSVIPVARDGSKRPDAARLPRVTGDDGRSHATWDQFKVEPPTREVVEMWFRGTRPPGIGVICGEVSGGLETLDFDARAEDIFPAWRELVEAEAPGLVARLSIARTPKPGYHVRYRCPDMPIPGNTKLAMDPAAAPDERCLIETRGEGGYAVAPGSPVEVHKTGRPYEHDSGPPLERVQPIGIEERDILIRCARSFDRSPPPEPAKPKAGRGDGLSPGDDYDRRGPDWPSILEPHGWVAAYHRGNVTYWRRPGKDGPGWSATTGACTSKAGRQLFAVFSTNAHPFPGPEGGRPCSTHDKFATYTLLNHGGDFSAAARALAEQGYGETRTRPSRNGTATERPGAAPASGPEAATAAGPASDAAEPHEQAGAAWTPVRLTDRGNGLRLVTRFGTELRYCHPWRRWMFWDERRWKVDDTGGAMRRAKQTITLAIEDALREIAALTRAMQEADEDAEKVLKGKIKLAQKALTWYVKSEAAERLKAMLNLAQSDPPLPILPDAMDRYPLLLNTPSGTLDLGTGELRPHSRGDYLTRLCPVPYDPRATCPLWEASLARIFAGDAELVEFCQRLCGLFLSGDVTEHLLIVCHGNGANGKSLLLNILLALLGTDYAVKCPPDLFLWRKGETHPTERAILHGKRLAVCSETPQGRHLNESLIKEMTGGEPITARRMREDFWSYDPTHKLVVATNYKPAISGDDDGIWRRLRLIPFEVKFWDADDPTNHGRDLDPALRQDKQLFRKLKRELPGILGWCVRGCLAWQRDGLTLPDKVRAATSEYRHDEDRVGRFVVDRCVTGPECRVRASDLYAAFKGWCEATGERCLSQTTFGEAVNRGGFQRYTNNGTWYRGIMLREHDAP
jgi:putative DNA primase/helicase